LGGQPVPVLKGIDLAVRPGKILAIMGASGSGKSTLLNIIGRLDRPTTGAYLFEGTDISLFSKDDLAMVRSKKIGFVFQQFNLLARGTTLKNVELPMLYAGVPPAQRKERALFFASAYGLGRF